MQKDYKDIPDWRHLDYKLEDHRLRDLFYLFLKTLGTYRKLMLAAGFRQTDFNTLETAFTYYYRAKSNGDNLNSLQLKNDNSFENVLKGIKDDGVFTVTLNYKHFADYRWSFYKPESKTLSKLQMEMDYFVGSPEKLFGPRADDSTMERIKEEYICLVPNLYDKESVLEVMERIDDIEILKTYNQKFTNLNERVGEILNEHRDNLNKQLEEQKDLMTARQYEKYSKGLERSYDSLLERYFWGVRIMERANNN